MLSSRFVLCWKRSFDGMNRCASTCTKIPVNGVELAYKKVGFGEKVILLLPGALGSVETCFAPQLKGLNREIFTIVSWDPRGYGHSIPPKRDFSDNFFYRDAEDATQLMINLGFKKFSLLGWCAGGNTAAIMAAKNPDKIDKLVLWGSNAFVSEEDIELYENVRDTSKWSDRMQKPMVDLYGEVYFRKTWNEWIDALLKFFYEQEGDIYKKELKHISAPTLIIHGMKDAIIPYSQSDYLHKNIKGSVLDCWPDGKHNLHLKYADKFNAQVEEFLLNSQSRL